MKIEDLGGLSIPEKAVIYHAIISHIKSGNEYGYHNDRRHPAYLPPHLADGSLGDGPEINILYRTLKTLSGEAAEFGELSDDEVIASWRSFCELSVKYAKKRG